MYRIKLTKKEERKWRKIIKEDEFAKHIPMTIVKNENDVEEFFENSINAGSEGLMLKMLRQTISSRFKRKLLVKTQKRISK